MNVNTGATFASFAPVRIAQPSSAEFGANVRGPALFLKRGDRTSPQTASNWARLPTASSIAPCAILMFGYSIEPYFAGRWHTDRVVDTCAIRPRDGQVRAGRTTPQGNGGERNDCGTSTQGSVWPLANTAWAADGRTGGAGHRFTPGLPQCPGGGRRGGRTRGRHAGLASRSGRPWQVVGGVWLVVGIAAAFWSDHPFSILSRLVGIGLLGSGAICLLLDLRHKPRPWGPILVNIALTVAGIALIVWAEVSILAATLALGIYLLTARHLLPAEPPPASGIPRLGKIAHRRRWCVDRAGSRPARHRWVAPGRIPEPDDFYDPPADLPAEPGQLLRAEPFTGSIPEGAQAWRILYTTTRDEGIPAVASGVVMVPSDPRRRTSPGHHLGAWHLRLPSLLRPATAHS